MTSKVLDELVLHLIDLNKYSQLEFFTFRPWWSEPLCFRSLCY